MEKDLIFEELSVSNVVLEEYNRIFPIILERINQTQINNYYTINWEKTFPQKILEFDLEDKIFGLISKVKIIVTYLPSKEDYFLYSQNLNLEGETNFTNNTLLLSLFGFNDKINLKFFESTLKHELHHIYQASLYDISPTTKDLYKKANYIMNNELYIPNVFCKFAKLIYFFDKKEIDANMQSLYSELKTENGQVNKNNILINFDHCQEEYKSFKDFFYDERFMNDFEKMFGLTFKKAMNYIGNMINYFNIKKMKVLTKYHKEKQMMENQKKNFNKFMIF